MSSAERRSSAISMARSIAERVRAGRAGPSAGRSSGRRRARPARAASGRSAARETAGRPSGTDRLGPLLGGPGERWRGLGRGGASRVSSRPSARRAWPLPSSGRGPRAAGAPRRRSPRREPASPSRRFPAQPPWFSCTRFSTCAKRRVNLSIARRSAPSASTFRWRERFTSAKSRSPISSSMAVASPAPTARVELAELLGHLGARALARSPSRTPRARPSRRCAGRA